MKMWPQSQCLLGTLFSVLLITTLFAYTLWGQQSQPAEPTGWLERATLTGNWHGLRTKLESTGIGLRAGFTTESAANPAGGQRQSARYTQQVDFGADLDLNRLIGVQGATVQITFNDRVGRSLSADAIGNLFSVQQLYGDGQNFRIVDLNYQQTLFADKLNFEVGWQPAGDFFASLPGFCDFQNGFTPATLLY